MPRKLWERMDGESAKAFAAFCAYLELGDERSVRAVGQKLDKSRTQIGKWSAAFKWVERAAAYDAEQWRAEREREQRDARKMRKRQLEAAEAYQQKAMDAFNLLSPSDLKPGEILRFFVEGAKLERELRRDTDAYAERKEEADSASGGFSEAMIQAHRRRTEGEA